VLHEVVLYVCSEHHLHVQELYKCYISMVSVEVLHEVVLYVRCEHHLRVQVLHQYIYCI
jgi:hypothetical protein